MTESIALIIVGITILGLFYTIHYLLNTLREVSKLIKADNLQEYTIGNEIENEKIEVGQEDERYQDIGSMTENQVKQIRIDPSNIYRGVLGGDRKTEKFN